MEAVILSRIDARIKAGLNPPGLINAIINVTQLLIASKIRATNRNT